MLRTECCENGEKSTKQKATVAWSEFPSHEDQLANLSRIEGQIRGIAKMVEDKRYCLEILHQLKSVHAALEGVEKKIFRRFLETCVRKAFLNSKNEDIGPLLDDIVRLFEHRYRGSTYGNDQVCALGE